MTQALISRLRELDKAATAGPWEVSKASYVTNGKTITNLYVQTGDNASDVEICKLNGDEDEDAALIAEMRTALPVLLERIEALEAALKLLIAVNTEVLHATVGVGGLTRDILIAVAKLHDADAKARALIAQEQS